MLNYHHESEVGALANFWKFLIQIFTQFSYGDLHVIVRSMRNTVLILEENSTLCISEISFSNHFVSKVGVISTLLKRIYCIRHWCVGQFLQNFHTNFRQFYYGVLRVIDMSMGKCIASFVKISISILSKSSF